jgi:hypothetical protein
MDQQEFTELTDFQAELDLEIITHLEAQKARIDQKLAALSDTELFLINEKGRGQDKNPLPYWDSHIGNGDRR